MTTPNFNENFKKYFVALCWGASRLAQVQDIFIHTAFRQISITEMMVVVQTPSRLHLFFTRWAETLKKLNQPENEHLTAIIAICNEIREETNRFIVEKEKANKGILNKVKQAFSSEQEYNADGYYEKAMTYVTGILDKHVMVIPINVEEDKEECLPTAPNRFLRRPATAPLSRQDTPPVLRSRKTKPNLSNSDTTPFSQSKIDTIQLPDLPVVTVKSDNTPFILPPSPFLFDDVLVLLSKIAALQVKVSQTADLFSGALSLEFEQIQQEVASISMVVPQDKAVLLNQNMHMLSATISAMMNKRFYESFNPIADLNMILKRFEECTDSYYATLSDCDRLSSISEILNQFSETCLLLDEKINLLEAMKASWPHNHLILKNKINELKQLKNKYTLSSNTVQEFSALQYQYSMFNVELCQQALNDAFARFKKTITPNNTQWLNNKLLNDTKIFIDKVIFNNTLNATADLEKVCKKFDKHNDDYHRIFSGTLADENKLGGIHKLLIQFQEICREVGEKIEALEAMKDSWPDYHSSLEDKISALQTLKDKYTLSSDFITAFDALQQQVVTFKQLELSKTSTEDLLGALRTFESTLIFNNEHGSKLLEDTKNFINKTIIDKIDSRLDSILISDKCNVDIITVQRELATDETLDALKIVIKHYEALVENKNQLDLVLKVQCKDHGNIQKKKAALSQHIKVLSKQIFHSVEKFNEDRLKKAAGNSNSFIAVLSDISTNPVIAALITNAHFSEGQRNSLSKAKADYQELLEFKQNGKNAIGNFWCKLANHPSFALLEPQLASILENYLCTDNNEAFFQKIPALKNEFPNVAVQSAINALVVRLMELQDLRQLRKIPDLKTKAESILNAEQELMIASKKALITNINNVLATIDGFAEHTKTLKDDKKEPAIALYHGLKQDIYCFVCQNNFNTDAIKRFDEKLKLRLHSQDDKLEEHETGDVVRFFANFILNLFTLCSAGIITYAITGRFSTFYNQTRREENRDNIDDLRENMVQEWQRSSRSNQA